MKQMRKAAQRFLQLQDPARAPAQLAGLLGDASRHLVGLFGLIHDDAYDIALSVWSEIEGRRSHCHVDLQLSTAHLIFLVDPVAGTRRAIPVVDLVRLLGPRPVFMPSAAAADG